MPAGPSQPDTVETLGHIKGVAFREFATWYAEHVSAEHVRTVVRNLEPVYPNTLDAERPGYGILATRWYDAGLVHAFLDRLVAPHGGADVDRLAQDAALAIMNHTLSGVYKFLFSTFATPDLYARHVNKLWSLHYDSGTTVVEKRGDDDTVVRYLDWKSHHPLICKLNMSATTPIYTAMGLADVSWRKLSCVSEGQTACALSVRWRR